jgi:ADP-dependent phosphofructokinase/glucokinase
MIYKNINVNLLSLPKIDVACGLWAHWDSVVKMKSYLLNWIVDTYKEKPKYMILESLEEVAYTLDDAIRNGGKEYLISEDVYVKFRSILKDRELRIGGNGFNMAQMLFMAGINPIVSYPSRSRKLMQFSPKFRVVEGESLKTPLDAVRLIDQDYEHIIVEMEKTRHILSWDPITSQGIFDNDFLNFATNSSNADLLLLAYAHLILPSYKKKTDEIVDLLKTKRPKVHLEIGLGSKESMEYAMKQLSDNQLADSWGMNEMECKEYLKSGTTDLEDMKEAALMAVEEYNVDRICVHTPEFSFTVSKYDMDREYKALVTASVFAAARTFGDINLEVAKNLPSTTVESVKERIGNYSFCLVPCLMNRFPKVLTGIGDSFAAINTLKALG